MILGECEHPELAICGRGYPDLTNFLSGGGGQPDFTKLIIKKAKIAQIMLYDTYRRIFENYVGSGTPILPWRVGHPDLANTQMDVFIF